MAAATENADIAPALELYRQARRAIEEAELELRRAEGLGEPSPAFGQELEGLKTKLGGQRRALVRYFNDALRRTLTGGRMLATHGVVARGQEFVTEALNGVRAFADFTPDNDPHEEHDFGRLEIEGTRIFWKIDYYDLEERHGSEDPADPALTTRVLTVMLAEEY